MPSLPDTASRKFIREVSRRKRKKTNWDTVKDRDLKTGLVAKGYKFETNAGRERYK